MSLFVVRHSHEPARCPAGDPKMGAMLLQHLSASNAKKFGLTIHGEAVINNAHTLYLIVEGPSREKVNGFMQPFAQAGSVEVLPASPCEEVIHRGGCGPAG